MSFKVPFSERDTVVTNSYPVSVNIAPYKTGDILLICIGMQGGSATSITTPSGWYAIDTYVLNAGSTAIHFLVKRATADSSNDTTQSVTISGGVSHIASIIVRDVPSGWESGTFVLNTDYAKNHASSVGTISLAAASASGYLDGLMIVACIAANTSQAIRAPIDDFTPFANILGGSFNGTMVAGYRQLSSTDGSNPQIDCYFNSSASCSIKCLIIPNSTGGTRQPRCISHITEEQWYGTHGANNTVHMNPTFNTLAGDTVNSIVEYTGTVTVSTASNTNPDTGLTTSSFTTISTASDIGNYFFGKKHDFTSDLSDDQILYLTFMLNAGASAVQYGTEGVVLKFKDNSGNWSAFQLIAKASTSNSKLYAVFIQPSLLTPYAIVGGGADFGDLASIEYLIHRASGSASALTLSICDLFIFDKNAPAELVGGGDKFPVSYTEYVEALVNWNHYRLVTLPTNNKSFYSGATVAFGSLCAGDGGNSGIPAYFDSTAQSISWPREYDPVVQNAWKVANNTVGMHINRGSNDTINFVAGAVTSPSQQNFTVKNTSYTNQNIDFFGQVFVGMAPTLLAGFTYSAATFSRCATVETGGGNLTNIIINNTAAATDEATVSINTDDSTLTGCTISADQKLSLGDVTAYFIELAADVLTLTLNNQIWESAPSICKIHALATTGTVSITIGGSTSLVLDDIQTEGADKEVIGSPVNQSVTVTNLQTTWRIQIYDESVTAPAGSRELYNGIPGTSSYVWTDPLEAAASRDIRLRVMNETNGDGSAIIMIDQSIGTCGITEGTEAISFLVNAVEDTVDTLYGIDGSLLTGFSINDTSFLMTISAGTVTTINGVDVVIISAKDLYAYETYWLGTEEGIRDEARFINAIDGANLRFSNFKLKGTTGYPIIIVDAYVVDDATGYAASMVDYSGDPISFAPEHAFVVTVTTSSGVVTGDLADFIAAVPSANTVANAVHSNALALTVPKFMGLK